MLVQALPYPADTGPVQPLMFLNMEQNPVVNQVDSVAATMVGTTFTSGAWFSSGSGGGGGQRIEFHSQSYLDVSADWTFEVHFDSNAAQDGCLIGRDGSGASRFWAFVSNGGLVSVMVGTSTILTGSVNVHSFVGFVHIAIVKDSAAGRWSLYVDGKLDTSVISSAVNTAATTRIQIGSTPGADETTQNLAGAFDRAVITNDAVYPYAAGNFVPPQRHQHPTTNPLSSSPLTTDEYTHYRIVVSANDGGTNVSCAELQLFDADNRNFVGRDHSDVGTATASSTVGGSGISAANAFNGHMNAPVGWVSNGTTSGWLRMQCASAEEFTGVAITNRPAEANRSPNSFTIEYSDDGTNWSVAHTEPSETGWNASETKRFTWTSVGAHVYWRINVASVDGGAYIGIATLTFIRPDGTPFLTTHHAAAAILATDYFSTSYYPVHMLRGQWGTGWVSAAGAAKTVTIHLPVAKALHTLGWRANPSEGNRAPKNFTIEGSNSPFNTGWTTLKTISNSTGWASNERRLFDGAS